MGETTQAKEQAPADSGAISAEMVRSRAELRRHIEEIKRRDAAKHLPDAERPALDIDDIPEVWRRYHPDGSWCARGWPCELEHLRGRPGEPEPVPARPQVVQWVGLSVDPATTPDGLFVQTVYGVGCFVMWRDTDGRLREVVGPYISGVRCQHVIDGMRAARRMVWLDGVVVDDPKAEEVAPAEDEVPTGERHYHKDGSYCRTGHLCERGHIAPEMMAVMLRERQAEERAGERLDALAAEAPASTGLVYSEATRMRMGTTPGEIDEAVAAELRDPVNALAAEVGPFDVRGDNYGDDPDASES